MPTLHSLAGKAAGVLALAGFIPYILATLKGTNRPNRATWIIWGLVGIVLLLSYKKAGATDAIWTSVANLIAFTSIIVLSFKYGEGGWNRFDLTCLAGACLGLFLWWRLSSPLPSLYLSMAVDFIGALPTIKKSYRDPAGENRLTWLIFWMANTLNLLAIEHWNYAMALYPLYLCFISGLIWGILVMRQGTPLKK